MRRHQQRQILELLQTIKEAQEWRLYADCQEGALAVGGFIEYIVGEGTQTVALLEDYCELLFKASNGEIGKKQLRERINQINDSFLSELKPDKIEIAFLSYKASMSDSIESIYLAAKDDPDCDAYWIPIPYYDKNSDGSFGAMRYEGAECYGEKIECTNWQEYDIEARHPDVIFTFNPYDAGNYVTSVHPDYYCGRLKNFTDLLVYIPYFVVAIDVPEHFCATAGCINASVIILQSELVRDTYIRVYSSIYGNKYGRPEDKFIALGSPKFDKVINCEREDFLLPNEWATLISQKTVIFYNTSIGSILQGSEQYLKKLRNVIENLQNQTDIVLWWRPHPLSEATFASMRPQLCDEYKQIVAEYKSKGKGIYDDTPDVHRAIAWTDAYYGDEGSLFTLYGLTQKPMMLQNISITDESFIDTDVVNAEIKEKIIKPSDNESIEIKPLMSEHIISKPNEKRVSIKDAKGTYAYSPRIQETAEFSVEKFAASMGQIPNYEAKKGASHIGKRIFDYIKTIPGYAHDAN